MHILETILHLVMVAPERDYWHSGPNAPTLDCFARSLVKHRRHGSLPTPGHTGTWNNCFVCGSPLKESFGPSTPGRGLWSCTCWPAAVYPSCPPHVFFVPHCCHNPESLPWFLVTGSPPKEETATVPLVMATVMPTAAPGYLFTQARQGSMEQPFHCAATKFIISAQLLCF